MPTVTAVSAVSTATTGVPSGNFLFGASKFGSTDLLGPVNAATVTIEIGPTSALSTALVSTPSITTTTAGSATVTALSAVSTAVSAAASYVTIEIGPTAAVSTAVVSAPTAGASLGGTLIVAVSAISVSVGPTFSEEIVLTPDSAALSTAVAPTPSLAQADLTISPPSAVSTANSSAPQITILVLGAAVSTASASTPTIVTTGSRTITPSSAVSSSTARVPSVFQGATIVTGVATPHYGPTTVYVVEVSWGQTNETGGVFTFGSSTLGGLDTLTASSWSGSFNVPYGDLTAMIRHIQIVRGRGDLLSSMQAGQLSLDLEDPYGLLNVRNPGSPLAGALYTGVPLRVSAYTQAGVKHPIYYGFLDTLTSDPGGRYGTAQITATDLFGRMDVEKPNLGSLDGPMTDGDLFNALLASIGWTDPALISLAPGDALPSPYTRADGTNSVVALVEEALLAERGYFFIAGDGTVTYKSRNQVLTGVSQTTIDREMRSAPSTLDASRVRNRWTVTRVGMDGSTVFGVPQVAAVDVGDESYRRYHYIDDSITTPMLRDDNQALALAQYLLALTKNPSGVGWTVPIVPSDGATLDQLILRDLGDRITLNVSPLAWPAYSQDYSIQQITHDITTDPTQTRHTTTWGLEEFPAGRPFTLGLSTLGGSDYLTY